MTNEQIIQKLNAIDEDLGFLEEIIDRSIVEDRIEDLRTLRYYYEQKLFYQSGNTYVEK